MDLDRMFNLEYLGLKESDVEDIINPLENRSILDMHEPQLHILRLMRNPNYFYFTCKYLFNIELSTSQCVVLKELWTRRFPLLIGCRGFGKSFLLGLYAVLRALLIQGSKVVITGSGFRQAKTVFNYSENIWHSSPMLRSLVSGDSRSGPFHNADKWILRLGDSTVSALPIGVDGGKIRGERANVVIGDEFASIPKEIYETVIAGFGVVNLSPIEKSKEMARIRVLKKLGRWSDEAQEDHRSNSLGNQNIISGTAYYQFNHFYSYWKRWKEIIESQGDPKKLQVAFGGDMPVGLDWRDYSIIRIPVDMVQEGYMDKEQVARSKATIHSGIYLNEFGACFSADSNGFFKRTLIESCVTTSPVTPNVPGAEPVQFRPMIRGNHVCKYIMGIDPASEKDNFSIVVLEIRDDHRRIVHCWTTDKQRFRAKLDAKLTKIQDYYGYCARRIRELLRTFPCEAIAIDTQGGGYAVLEALHDPDKMEQGELPIWPVPIDHILSDKKKRDVDIQPGLHMANLVSFSDAQWTADANHGMRKDFEDRILLFPMQDAVMLFEANVEDQLSNRIYDTLEECVDEIEELKAELSTITHSQTPGTLRDHWDTPELKTEGSKKGRLRKDRYSALLMANSAARRLQRKFEMPQIEAYGGFTNHMAVPDDRDEMYAFAPDWFKKQTEDDFGDYGMV